MERLVGDSLCVLISRRLFSLVLLALSNLAVRLPFLYPTKQVRVALIADECPALLIAGVWFRHRMRISPLYQRLGVLHVAVYSLEGGLDAMLL